MSTPKFTGKVIDGKIDFFSGQKVYLNNYLRTLEGERIELSVKKFKPTRTLPQNSYLHGVVFSTIANETGNDLDTVKDTLKEMFASTIDENGWRHIEKTSKMSTERISKFIEDVCRWASMEMGIYIPPPNEG